MVTDATSSGLYRVRPLSRATYNVSDAAALAIANLLLAQYKDPKQRLEGFQVRPTVIDAIWTGVITLDCEHTITVNRRPPGGGTMFTATPKVLGLSWNVPDMLGKDTTIGYTLSA